MENVILSALQNSGPPPNFGAAPAWASFPSADFPQATVDFFINEGYRAFLSDTADMELFLVEYTFLSTENTSTYAFPIAGYAECAEIARIYYQPVGLPYTREFDPGVEFTSWQEFQRITGQGYLLPYSFGTQPQLCAVDPLRQNIVFYPGSANVGDTITVQYIPLPTGTATGCPLLVNPTDTPVTKSDTHLTICYRAAAEIWIQAREAQTAAYYMKRYEDGVAKIRKRYELLSHGDTKRIKPFADSLSIGVGVGL
jgi:hypothetical protein